MFQQIHTNLYVSDFKFEEEVSIDEINKKIDDLIEKYEYEYENLLYEIECDRIEYENFIHYLFISDDYN